MRPAPLPVRDGLGPARVRLQGGPVLAELTARFGAQARRNARAGARSNLRFQDRRIADLETRLADPATAT